MQPMKPMGKGKGKPVGKAGSKGKGAATCKNCGKPMTKGMLQLLRDMWGSLGQAGRIAMMVLGVALVLTLVWWGYGEILLGLL